MRDSSAVSDHFLVRAKVKFRISIERSKRMKCTKKINEEELKRNMPKITEKKLRNIPRWLRP